MIAVTLIDSMGTDISTVNAARVSFGKKSELVEVGSVIVEDAEGNIYDEPMYGLNSKDGKLVKYLAEHKHISPFGHAAASFHVKAPLFVARQLVKHKFLRWNEISKRYHDGEPEFYEPKVWRGRSADKKQGSEGEVQLSDDVKTGPEFLYHEAKVLYREMLEEGVCPEQARMVLPQAMMTEWYWSGSLDAFASMCNLRCTDDTQAETRIVADAIDNEMEGLFPVSWRALREYA